MHPKEENMEETTIKQSARPTETEPMAEDNTSTKENNQAATDNQPGQ